jgi:hypothetical protein
MSLYSERLKGFFANAKPLSEDYCIWLILVIVGKTCILGREMLYGSMCELPFWWFMLACEPLCLSTQTVISLSLKLKRGLNVLLPTHVGLGAPALECSIRDFFEAQKLMGCTRAMNDMYFSFVVYFGSSGRCVY